MDSNRKSTYTITVGEVGNEIGHQTTGQYLSGDHAIRAAKRAVACYKGDGWYTVTNDRGEVIARQEAR